MQCWCRDGWGRKQHLSKRGCTWNTSDDRDRLKPTALFPLIGHVILSVKPIPHTVGVRLSTRLRRYGPVSPACFKVHSSGRTSLSISSQNDLFIITWRSEETFSFCLNASRYTFPLLETVGVLVDGYRKVLSPGDLPQEAIMVHNYRDHPCGMAQLW